MWIMADHQSGPLYSARLVAGTAVAMGAGGGLLPSLPYAFQSPPMTGAAAARFSSPLITDLQHLE